MKNISKWILSFMLLFSLCGCAMFKDASDTVKDDMDKEENKVEDKVEDSADNTGSVSDLITYLKDHKIEVGTPTNLENFDFAAKEGKSFTYDGNKVYVYAVDLSNAAVRTLMNQAQQNNEIVANKDGKEVRYGASVNQNYLLVYDLEAKVEDLLENFANYKNEKKDSAN